jgi:hypothetical protein
VALDLAGSLAAAPEEEVDGIQLWKDVIGTLSEAAQRHQRIQGHLNELRQQGLSTTKVEARVSTWLDRVQKLANEIARVIGDNAAVQWVIDSVASTMEPPDTGAASGLSGVVIAGAWRDLVSALRPAASHGVAGLGILPALAVLGRALLNPVVMTWVARIILGALAVAGAYMASLFAGELRKTLRGDTDAIRLLGEAVEKCINAAKNLPDKAERQRALDACGKLHLPEDSMWTYVAGGVAALGLLLYLRPVRAGAPVALSGLQKGRKRYVSRTW